MARNTNIYSNHWNGSAGWGTSRQLRGQTIVSQKSLGPTNERTPIQVGNEKSMATLVALGRPALGGIHAGFNELKVKNKPNKCNNTAWGAFIGQNRAYANGVFTYATPDDPTFHPANFITAKGTIESTPITTATGDVSAKTISLTWPTTAVGVGQNANDKPRLILYNETTDTSGYLQYDDPNRNDGTGTWDMGDTDFHFIITDVVRAYLFFEGYELTELSTVRQTGKESDSINMVVTLSA